jgi:hypothetical protein
VVLAAFSAVIGYVGVAAANNVQNGPTNYYTWSGFGVLCAYEQNGFIHPGLFGGTWQAYNFSLANGGSSCSTGYSGAYQDSEVDIDIWDGSGWNYCGGDYIPWTQGQNIGTVVSSGGGGICDSYLTAFVSGYSTISWDGDTHRHSQGLYH